MPTRKLRLRKSRKRKLRKPRGGKPSKWWERQWLTNKVSTDKNKEECRKNAEKWNDHRFESTNEDASRDSDIAVNRVIEAKGDKNKTEVENLADLACGSKGNEEMVWSNFGFWYDDEGKKKRVRQHAITRKFRTLMKRGNDPNDNLYARED